MASTTNRIQAKLYQQIRRVGPYTVVNVPDPDYPESWVSGLGVAKRHPNDKDNRRIGYQVALSRALRDYADKIEGHALG
jgi:hypothetical protein